VCVCVAYVHICNSLQCALEAKSRDQMNKIKIKGALEHTEAKKQEESYERAPPIVPSPKNFHPFPVFPPSKVHSNQDLRSFLQLDYLMVLPNIEIGKSIRVLSSSYVKLSNGGREVKMGRGTDMVNQ